MLSALSEARDDHLRGTADGITSNPWGSDSRVEHSFVNDYFEMEQSKHQPTFCCCYFRKRRYTRVRRRNGSSGETEEYTCLVDCDELELGLTDNREADDDSRTRKSRFEDDFV